MVQSEDKSVVLNERWVLLEHVLHESIDLFACFLNLIVEGLLLATLLLELNELI